MPRVFDSSSIIYAWDNYPPSQFPSLWEWLRQEFTNGSLFISVIALEEVEYKSADCLAWLKNCLVEPIGVTDEVLRETMRIKKLLGIQGEAYSGKGVDEYDLLIIAIARIHKMDLISNESRQKFPEILAKSKIPNVCAMPQVSVACINFLEYFKDSKQIFG